MAGPKYDLRDGRGQVTFSLDPITLRAYLTAMNGLPKDIQNEIRANSKRLSMELADDMKRVAYTAIPPVAKRVALSITTPRDRLPTVKVGGSKRVGLPYKDRATGAKIKAQAGELLYGSEYGGRPGKDRAGREMGNRFKAPRNKSGYWINPTSEAWGEYLFKQWVEMVDTILKREGIRG